MDMKQKKNAYVFFLGIKYIWGYSKYRLKFGPVYYLNDTFV